MTVRNIFDSLSDKRKDQMACIKGVGGTLFAVKGIIHDTESDLYCLTFGSMPEDEPVKIIDDKQMTIGDLFKELGI